MNLHGTLRRIKSNHRNLRTDEVEGVARSVPTVGEDFVMLAEGLEFGTRLIQTTPVLAVRTNPDASLEFVTANSIYCFTPRDLTKPETSG